MNSLYDLLHPDRLTEIVDIGANPIDGDPPYKPMLKAGLCHVTGFEPQENALAELNLKKGVNERYLPYAIADGDRHNLNVCRGSGMTSLLEPDNVTLEIFSALSPLGEVTKKIDIYTKKLDDVAEIDVMDFLKIDIQGGELSVFKSGKNKLEKSVFVQVEVSFITLYKNQPSFGDIDLEMRSQGFIPHCFPAIKKWPISPCVINNDPRIPLNQLLEADIAYVRDFIHPEKMNDEQLKHTALIAHHCYNSFDLALRCIMILEQRQAIEKNSQSNYLNSFKK